MLEEVRKLTDRPIDYVYVANERKEGVVSRTPPAEGRMNGAGGRRPASVIRSNSESC